MRALDRFSRRLQAMNKLLPNADFACAGNDIVLKIARERVHQYLETLTLQFAGRFMWRCGDNYQFILRYIGVFIIGN